MSQTETVTETKTQKVKVSIKGVQKMLEDGKTREEIGNELGLSRADRIRLFKVEGLKGRKTHKDNTALAGFEIVDDEEAASDNGSGDSEATQAPAEALASSAREKW